MQSSILNILKHLFQNFQNNKKTKIKLDFPNKNYQNQPKISIQFKLNSQINKYQYFAIIMADPDAPSMTNPISADFIHWISVNNHNTPSGLTNGTNITSYMGPHPPKNSGIHHYITLVFGYNNLIDESIIYDVKKSMIQSGRSKQNTQEIIKKLLLKDEDIIGYQVFEVKG